jgi:hypothetical protein
MFRNNWLLLSGNIVFSIVLFLVIAADYTLVNYINALFYICFIYVLAALLFLVVKGGFIDGITYGFRRFRATMSKKEDYLEEWKDRAFLSEKISGAFHRAVAFQAWALLVLLVCLMIFYYI